MTIRSQGAERKEMLLEVLSVRPQMMKTQGINQRTDNVARIL
jgi:hypothetical protein